MKNLQTSMFMYDQEEKEGKNTHPLNGFHKLFPVTINILITKKLIAQVFFIIHLQKQVMYIRLYHEIL